MDIFMHDIAYSTKEIDIRIVLAKKLHRPPFPTDPPLNFHVHLFKNRRAGMLTLPTQEAGRTFLSTYDCTGIKVNGGLIKFQHSNRPLNERRVRHICSIPWEDPKVLEMRNRQKAEYSEPIELQGFAFGRFCRDGCFLVDSDSLGKGDIACDQDLRQIRLIVREDLANILGLNPDVDWNGIHSDLFSRKIASYTPSQIKTVIATDPSRAQTPHLVILESDTPPFLETQQPRILYPSSYRIPSLYDDCQMPPSCHSLKLGLQTRKDAIHTKRVSHIQAMADLDHLLLTMKFELAFEVEKSVLNGDLEPFEILSLSNTIDSLSSTPSGLSPAAFRCFVSTLQGLYPGRRRRMHSRGPMPRASDLNLDQMLIDATKCYSVKSSSSKINPYLVTPATFECYHLIVTPTSRYLEGPIPDQSNSILRRFGNHECFLRVSIQDERRSKIRREPGIRISNLLESQFGVLLTDGLHLGGRQYEFLGYSMSGLRDHSVWFVTPFKSDTGHTMDAAKIRKKLGNFSKLVYEPARLAARWSQAFSATDPSVTLNPDEILRIEDRISPQGPVFTDGCGTISPELCRAVWTKLKRVKARYSKFHAIPSCLQFRLGGAKGVVVQDPTLNGKVICLRPSQIKFDGLDNFTFDVQSTSSRPRLMFLNRPLIMLLEHLGVKRDVITNLQSTSIREVQSIQTSLTQATNFFLQYNLGTSYHLPSLFNNISKYLGLDISDLPGSLHHHLMEEALYCAATHALREIKYRAHILVPGSVTLLGVSDEYDCLAEGEIFATVYDESKATEQFIEGKVLITRSPQVHPGDVQLVTAVRRPELNHLKNVVVISCRGARSLPSCLGGGDIDGDEYNIITNPNLHPPRTVTPGSYEPLERERTTRPCTIEDVADFVINYIENDLLGHISILHLRIAYLNAEEGPECEECIQLAEAASHAVDFPKTGTPVDFSSLPRPSSHMRPDFLAPESVDSVVDNDLYYPSEKLLGILFRNVPAAKRRESRNDASNTSSDGGSIFNSLMEIHLSELGLPPLELPQDGLREEMVQLLSEYSERLASIAQIFTFSRLRGARISEAELVSGTITGKWSDNLKVKRREAVIAMNLQTHELCTSVRRALRRASLQDSDINDNFQKFEDEESEIDDDELVLEKRAEVFGRAWAAWRVAEDRRTEDPTAFGPQSFGLIALGLLLDVIKDVMTAADACH